MFSNAKNFVASGSNAEDTMMFTTAPHTMHLDRELYLEAAKRVVSANCQSKCEITSKYFDKNFYDNEQEKGHCYEACYNNKMALHFGETTQKNQNLRISLAEMKNEFNKYERMNPYYEIRENMNKAYEPKEFEPMAEQLVERT
jgi:hypothetical protein